jgi:hypothetical protein
MKLVYESLDEFNFNLNEDWRSKLAKGIVGAAFVGGMMGTPAYSQSQNSDSQNTEIGITRTKRETISPGLTSSREGDKEPMLHMACTDGRWSSLEQMITLFYGNPKECYKFLTQTLNFLEKYKSESDDISGKLSNGSQIEKRGKSFIIYAQDGKGGYESPAPIKYGIMGLNKHLAAFKKWAQINNISLE